MIKKAKKAFTITELVIVIAVIAILAGVLIPTFGSVIENSHASAAMQNCRNAMVAINSEKAVKGEGETANGTVFENGGYLFVLYNQNLQKIGKLDDTQKKVNIATDGTIQNSDKAYTGITVNSGATTAITIANDADTIASITIADLAATSEKAAENVFFYVIEVNGAKVYGAFTFEGVGAKFVQDEVTYSRVATYSVDSAITVTAKAA